ncbi:uncharacterized protein LOC112638035 [Camponotus floridanus]|uniref:uncharacterized protein LOC112638035 n=1 Tax=Camponotus floridanus TaxID=104421 RepID=UPI000DC695D6|nr:uncharacterized protein LOC112638035 [Camponotus floridanus]
MTGDYAKAREFANRLLKHDRNDADVTRALNILEQKNQHKIEEGERLGSIDVPIDCDNECEGCDAIGEDADFVGVNADSRIDPRMISKIASYDMFRLNIDKAKTNLNFKQRMHRVIPIKINGETTNKLLHLSSNE